MSKILGIALAAITLVMALACGGSYNGPNPTTYSFKGTVDYDAIGASTTGISVKAYDSTGAVAGSTASLVANSAADAPAGTDYEFTVTGIPAAGDYTFKVVKTDSSNSDFELLSTIGTVSSTSGTISKPYFGYTSAPQINLFTTFVVQQVKLTGNTVATVTTSILGVSTTSLSSVRVTGGAINVGGTQATVPSIVSQMVSLMSTSILSAVKLTTTELAANKTNLTAALNALNSINASSATTTTLSSSTVYTTIATMTTQIFATTTLTFTTFNTFITAALPDTSFTQGQLTSASNLTTAVSDQVSALDNAKKVTTFDLANSTYGAKTTTGFMVNTLAPVFKVVVSGNFSDNVVSDLLDIQIKHVATGTTLTYSTANSLVDSSATYSAGNTTIYLYVKKSASMAISAGTELRPGQDYSYTLTAKTKAFTFGGSFSTSGLISVRDVTFTYPYTGSYTSQVKLGGNGGVAAGSVVFYVNSAKDITVTTGTNYGILGANSALNVAVSPATSVTPVVSGITTGATTANAAVVTFNSVTTGNYTVTLSKDKGLFSGATEVTDYPSSVYMEVQ